MDKTKAVFLNKSGTTKIKASREAVSQKIDSTNYKLHVFLNSLNNFVEPSMKIRILVGNFLRDSILP